MTKTYAIETLENIRIQLLDQLDVLNSLGTGNFDGKRKELSEKLNNVKASISTLNENRGIKLVTDSGTIFFSNGNVKFEGNLEFSLAKPINEQGITQNITINIESVAKDVDINKFAKAFTDSIKRQQGVR